MNDNLLQEEIADIDKLIEHFTIKKSKKPQFAEENIFDQLLKKLNACKKVNYCVSRNKMASVMLNALMQEFEKMKIDLETKALETKTKKIVEVLVPDFKTQMVLDFKTKMAQYFTDFPNEHFLMLSKKEIIKEFFDGIDPLFIPYLCKKNGRSYKDELGNKKVQRSYIMKKEGNEIKKVALPPGRVWIFDRKTFLPE